MISSDVILTRHFRTYLNIKLTMPLLPVFLWEMHTVQAVFHCDASNVAARFRRTVLWHERDIVFRPRLHEPCGLLTVVVQGFRFSYLANLRISYVVYAEPLFVSHCTGVSGNLSHGSQYHILHGRTVVGFRARCSAYGLASAFVYRYFPLRTHRLSCSNSR